MRVRRYLVALGAVAFAVLGTSGPARAGSITDEVARPFEVVGTVFNDAPPDVLAGQRIYLDGDNFTANNLELVTPNSLLKRVDPARGTVGIKTPPITMFFVQSTPGGPFEPSDFAHTIVEGKRIRATGILVNMNTLVAKDQPEALEVDQFCC